jgi:hypothetical protein
MAIAKLPIFRSIIGEIRRRIFAMQDYFRDQIQALRDGKISTEGEHNFGDLSYVKNFLVEADQRNGGDRFNVDTLTGMLRGML